MTVFSNSMSLYAPLKKLSLINQWQFSQTPCPYMQLYRNCHWSMTISKIVIDQWQFSHSLAYGVLYKTVIDQSMTIFIMWLMAICLMDIVIDRTVNDNVHKLSWAKLSLTSINDKKNCHWVHLIYPSYTLPCNWLVGHYLHKPLIAWLPVSTTPSNSRFPQSVQKSSQKSIAEHISTEN